MSSSGTALAPVTQANPALLEQKLRLEGRIRMGAGWFLAVAIFSVINSVLVITDAKLHFIVGLGITQLVDSIGHYGGPVGSTAGFVISLIMAGVFLLFWKFAREKQQWAFFAGMALYACDGLLFLGFGLFLELAFHAFALYRMSMGLQSLNALNKLPTQ
jgi:hypothetical protein